MFLLAQSIFTKLYTGIHCLVSEKYCMRLGYFSLAAVRLDCVFQGFSLFHSGFCSLALRCAVKHCTDNTNPGIRESQFSYDLYIQSLPFSFYKTRDQRVSIFIGFIQSHCPSVFTKPGIRECQFSQDLYRATKFLQIQGLGSPNSHRIYTDLWEKNCPIYKYQIDHVCKDLMPNNHKLTPCRHMVYLLPEPGIRKPYHSHRIHAEAYYYCCMVCPSCYKTRYVLILFGIIQSRGTALVITKPDISKPHGSPLSHVYILNALAIGFCILIFKDKVFLITNCLGE